MSRKNMSERNSEIVLVYEQGALVKEIAEQFSLSIPQVYNILVAAGYGRKPKPIRPRLVSKTISLAAEKNYLKSHEHEIVGLFHSGVSVADIANKYNVSTKGVEDLIRFAQFVNRIRE